MQEDFLSPATEHKRFEAEQDRSKAEAVGKLAAISGEAERKRPLDRESARKRDEAKRAYREEERARQSESARDRRLLRILEKNQEDRLKEDAAMAAQKATEARRRAILPTASIMSLHRPLDHASVHDIDQDGIAHTYSRISEDTYRDTSPYKYANTSHRGSSPPYAASTSGLTGLELSAPTRSLYPSGLNSLALPRPSAPTGPALPSTAHIDVSEDIALDPREIMAKNELMTLVMERGMSKNREKETKALLARRLRESDRIASIGELHGWLRRRGLSSKGNRAELVWRLQEYDARMSKSWRPKHMATLLKSRDAVKVRFKRTEAERAAGERMLPRSGRFGISAGGVPLRAIGSSGQGTALLKDRVRTSVETEEGQRQSPKRLVRGSRPSVDTTDDDYWVDEQDDEDWD